MKILSAKQIREADQYTIEHEPITSIELMERAATACFKWIVNHFDVKQSFKVFCGTGNNGGDGLAIARMLHSNGYDVKTFIIRFGGNASEDFKINENR
ncbi:MAG: NAD(P)H-hydrate epimerase, partial [Bacteroidota bacterium]